MLDLIHTVTGSIETRSVIESYLVRCMPCRLTAKGYNRLQLRLPREYAEGRAHAIAGNMSARNVYQVRMELASLEHLPGARARMSAWRAPTR